MKRNGRTDSPCMETVHSLLTSNYIFMPAGYHLFWTVTTRPKYLFAMVQLKISEGRLKVDGGGGGEVLPL